MSVPRMQRMMVIKGPVCKQIRKKKKITTINPAKQPPKAIPRYCRAQEIAWKCKTKVISLK